MRRKGDSGVYLHLIQDRMDRQGLTPVFLYHGKTVHLRQGSLIDTRLPGNLSITALCGRAPAWPMNWMTTDTPEHIEKVGARPVCSWCLDRLDRIDRSDPATPPATPHTT